MKARTFFILSFIPFLTSSLQGEQKNNNVKIEKYSEEGFHRVTRGDYGLVVITKAFKNEIQSHLQTYLMQARTEAVVKNKSIVGFKLEEIDKGSIFEKAGFLNGDIITSIKGRSLRDASSAIKILLSLKKSQRVELDFMRKGKPHHLSVNVSQ